MSVDNLKDLRISQAEFGRLVGLSRQRVNQLAKLGVVEVDDGGGVKLFRSLENYFRMTNNYRYRYQKWRIFS